MASIARVLPMPQPDPDVPTPYLSTEAQLEASLSIDAVARLMAEQREGKHLDDLPLPDKLRYETAATLAWLWIDPAVRWIARHEAVQELTDQAAAENVDLQGYGADFGQCVVDAYERVLSGLAPVSAVQYDVAQTSIQALNHARMLRGWGRL